MSLTQRVISAVRWATGLTMLTQVLMWAVTIIVIRLLTPDDYGLMAMSMVFIGFVMLANELGLGAALVQDAELTDRKIRAVHGLVILLNFGLYLLFYAAASGIAGFFDEPALTDLIRVIAVLFPIYGFEVTPLALLEKRLEFKKKATIYLVANISGVLLSLVLALLDAGVWSLVYGNIWAALARAIAVNLVGGNLIRPILDLPAVKPMLGFGGFVAVERMFWYTYSQADVFLIGKFLGKEQLGYYYVALNLASLIYAKSGGLMYEVALPAFAEAQSDISKVGRFFVTALRVICFIAFPLMFGLAAVSSEAVELFLGETWILSAPLVLILSLSMPARILSNLLPPALQGTGHVRTSLTNLVLTTAMMVPALAFGAYFDIRSVALVWLVGFPIVLALLFARSRLLIGLTWPELIRSVLPPLAASAIMFAAVVWTGLRLLPADLSLPSRLVIMVSIGALSYLALSWFGMRSQLHESLRLIRR